MKDGREGGGDEWQKEGRKGDEEKTEASPGFEEKNKNPSTQSQSFQIQIPTRK